MSKKSDYALGNKKGPVMFDGTVFKSQRELNQCMGIAIIIAGFIPYAYGIKWVAIIMWIFGALAFLGSCGQKKK